MDFSLISQLMNPANFRLLVTNVTSLDYNSSQQNNNNNNNDKSGAAELSLIQLFLALCAPVAMIALSVYLKLDIGYKIIISITRTIVQLLFAGFVLLGFIFSIKSPFLVVVYLILMSMIAAHEVTTRQSRTYKGQYFDSFLAVLMGGLVSCYGALVVFRPNPWFNPHVLIPTAGMIIGGAMSGPALACDRLLTDIMERSHEPEVRLAFGGNRYEAVLPMLRAAIRSAMMPNLNGMAVVGLVNIPGMMTGQLLGGSPPNVAAEYQMAILWLIFTSAFLSTCTATYLTIRNIFGECDALTTNKIKKRSEMKGVLEDIQSMWKQSRSFVTNWWQSIPFPNKRHDSSSSSMTKHPSIEMYSAVAVFERSKSSMSSSGKTSVDSTNLDEENPPFSSSSEVVVQLTSSTSSSNSSTSSSSARFKTSNSSLSLSELVSDEIEIDSPTYKANYQVISNGTSTGTPDKATGKRSTASDSFFRIENFNVLSGDILLFGEDGFNMELNRRDIVTVEGCSGIGKTRLLRALAYLDCPSSGQAEFIGVDSVVTFQSGALWRRHVIYIPQALPALTGSPKEFVTECCGFSSRMKLPGTKELISSKFYVYGLFIYWY